MRLQVNTSGAWKDVIRFDDTRRDEIVKALKPLADAIGLDAKWSLLHEDGTREWLPRELAA